MLTFSQYRIEQALVIQKDMLQREIMPEPNFVLGLNLIGYYTDYLRIIGADEILINEISALTMNSYTTEALNTIIDEMVTKNQTEHNDY